MLTTSPSFTQTTTKTTIIFLMNHNIIFQNPITFGANKKLRIISKITNNNKERGVFESRINEMDLTEITDKGTVINSNREKATLIITKETRMNMKNEIAIKISMNKDTEEIIINIFQEKIEIEMDIMKEKIMIM